MRFLLFFAAILISSEALAEKRGGTVCYFSLNNHKEQPYMQNFANKLNALAGTEIKVIEYMPQGEKPEAAFKRMVEENANCDGLVISGHHYGEWEGVRANGSLKIDFLEKMSCDPKYSAWFKKIKSLHLQGCRTSGAGDISSNSANAHTSRVNAVVEEDSIERDFENINHGFTNILSRSNPLSVRYLKVFPRSTMFGWVDSAPGVLAKSETSLLYHIAHMAAINNPSVKYANPTKDISRESAIAMANATLDMLQKPDWDRCENSSVQAWNKHFPLAKGFNSYESAARRDPVLNRARELGCRLKFPADNNERIQVLKEILTDKNLVAQNMNTLSELMQGPHAKEVGAIMRESGQLKSFLGDEINTPQVGLFVKVDYYTFYKKVFGEKSASAEKIISDESLRYLTEAYPSDTRKMLDLRDFKATLTSSLAKNGFVNEEFMTKLYNYRTEASNQMFKVLYNKMFVVVNKDRSQTEMAALLTKLKPLKDSIP